VVRRLDVLCFVATSAFAEDDERTVDGVVDHARHLVCALDNVGATSELIAMNWRESGVLTAAIRVLRALWLHRPRRFLIHYSQLAWSRRGLPFGLLLLVAACRVFAPGCVWVHDPDRVSTRRLLRHRLASAVKGVGLRSATRIAGMSVVSVEPSRIYWAKGVIRNRLAFCASPSNVGHAQWNPPSDMFTVACFGIDVDVVHREGPPISHVAEELARLIGPFRLRVLGTSRANRTESFVEHLQMVGVECDAPGYLEADAVAERLATSHAYLAARGPLSSRSGALAAALACGLPIVGYAGAETGFPVNQAGVVFVGSGDAKLLAEALAALSGDVARQAELSRRSSQAAAASMSWSDVAVWVCERLTG
jgi:glycosyltransferase involved in cell wall biosynthesis